MNAHLKGYFVRCQAIAATYYMSLESAKRLRMETFAPWHQLGIPPEDAVRCVLGEISA
jgi:hypothetical protein